MRRRLLSMALAGVLCLSLTVPAFAAEQPAEIQSAGAYLRERGIYLGDETGNLKLDAGLTRAEMAAVLTRLHGEGEVDPNLYAWACYFEDVPSWARPYVGYCTANLLVTGYDAYRYGPNDPVNPAMACTVVLRCCGYDGGEGSEWNYGTACDYAVRLGLISQSTTQATAITRGEMAVLICRALRKQEEPQTPVAVAPSDSAYQIHPDGSITISKDAWSREDFSQQANPAVFTDVYDRELYNTIRQTLVDGTSETAPAYTMVAKGDEYSSVKYVIGQMGGILRYEHHVPENFTNYWQYLDYFAVSARMPENYQAPLEFIQPAVSHANTLATDREKVEYLNNYLRSLLTYEEGATSGITQTFAPHTKELKAACGSYAVAFSFLCSAVDIPCFTISSNIHTWNLVYVEGKWLHVDVSANDLLPNSSKNGVLLIETYQTGRDQAPDITAFLKELLIPGSTK